MSRRRRFIDELSPLHHYIRLDFASVIFRGAVCAPCLWRLDQVLYRVHEAARLQAPQPFAAAPDCDRGQ